MVARASANVTTATRPRPLVDAHTVAARHATSNGSVQDCCRAYIDSGNTTTSNGSAATAGAAGARPATARIRTAATARASSRP
ncbi:hypothetical protein CcI156_13300 [Frankia sp. CcI156]|nr:hypothetical protein CgIS1_13400 [Frankia sp. CgIS1]ONH25462.1 hypothetical protein CcI156_13300 [Frankia sp. CcI156]